MSVWITRPEADARRLVDGLRTQGLPAVVAPLFEADFLDVPLDALTDLGAILVTSRNGVRALARAGCVAQLKDVPLFAVGPGTAEEARSVGFAVVRQGTGHARDLPEEVARDATLANRPILYARGEDISVDLAAKLKASGRTVLEPTVYRMVPTDAPAGAVAAALRSGAIGTVTLFSPKAAERYLFQMTSLGLDDLLATLEHACLSERVASPLRGRGVPRIVVAAAPNLEEMLALTGRSAAK